MDSHLFSVSLPLFGLFVGHFLAGITRNLNVTSGSFDSSVHISEEATNAATVVPWAIVYAIGIAGVLGWGMSTSANCGTRS